MVVQANDDPSWRTFKARQLPRRRLPGAADP
jgi:hypothetical protein